MIIRKAASEDIDEIGKLYDALNDHLASHINYPGWVKGIYPTGKDAEAGLEENTLYVAEKDRAVAGTFILRHKPEPAYSEADWKVPHSYDEIYVLYTLAVHPDYLGQHIGDQIMEYIIDLAEKESMKAVRLDVYEKNIPAIRLYEKHGFQYIDTVDLGYSQYGLDRFRLYQYIL